MIDMPLLNTRNGKDLMGTFIADIVLQILSFVAESERSNIKKREAEGIAAARARGVHLGMPRKETPAIFPEIISSLENGEICLAEALKRSNMSQSLFYRRRVYHLLASASNAR